MQQGEQPHLLDPPQRHVHAEAGEAILPTQRPEISPGHTQIHRDHDGHDNLDRLALLAHPMQPVEDGNENGSYGTLMLSKEGQSKYLGPTAGSEWLKDVGHMAPTSPNKLNHSSRKRKMYSRHRQSLVLHLPKYPNLQFFPSLLACHPALRQSPFLLTPHQLASILRICFPACLQGRRRGPWPSRIIVIVLGSKCSTPHFRETPDQVQSRRCSQKPIQKDPRSGI